MKFTPCVAVTAALLLSACQMTAPPAKPRPPTGKLAVLLQTVNNISANPQPSLGNQAQLFKLYRGCLVQFDARHAGGEAHEFWTLRRGQLVSAFTRIQHDMPQAPLSASTSSPAPMVPKTERRDFDVRDPQVQQNFRSLLANFSADQVAQCN